MTHRRRRRRRVSSSGPGALVSAGHSRIWQPESRSLGHCIMINLMVTDLRALPSSRRPREDRCRQGRCLTRAAGNILCEYPLFTTARPVARRGSCDARRPQSLRPLPLGCRGRGGRRGMGGWGCGWGNCAAAVPATQRAAVRKARALASALNEGAPGGELEARSVGGTGRLAGP